MGQDCLDEPVIRAKNFDDRQTLTKVDFIDVNHFFKFVLSYFWTASASQKSPTFNSGQRRRIFSAWCDEWMVMHLATLTKTF